MRTLTKQWYQTMQDSGLGVLLEPDERAAEYSEELFQTIWEEKLHDWLVLRRELCPELGEVYDEEGERQYFVGNYRRELQQLRTRTPEEILNHVADIRLLALGVCTKAVFEALKEYRDRCRKWTEKTMDEAWNLRLSQGLDKVWLGEHSLHDSVVLSLKREREDLLIEFEREEADWPEIKAIRFRGGHILKREQPPENAWWLYDEIWCTEEGGYEIHALLWRESSEFELTIVCREPELIWTIPPEAE